MAMTTFELTSKERSLLKRLAASTDRARLLRRAQALLWLQAGDSPTEVADRLGVSRQTLYNWADRFHARSTRGIAERLDEGPRRGRPCTASGISDALLDEVLDDDPRAWGYHATIWTAPLLQQYLKERHAIPVSPDSVRDALARLRVRWKRPRHCLARRPDTWRQAKGGSNAACGTGCGRSC
jgi:transposase